MKYNKKTEKELMELCSEVWFKLNEFPDYHMNNKGLIKKDDKLIKVYLSKGKKVVMLIDGTGKRRQMSYLKLFNEIYQKIEEINNK
jgi:hypothetical protein